MMASRVATSTSAALWVVGLAAGLFAVVALRVQTGHDSLAIFGSLIGSQVVVVSCVIAVSALVAAGVVTIRLGYGTPSGHAAKAWVVAGGVVAFVIAAPLAVQGGFAGTQLIVTQYTDLGTTRDGVQLYSRETSWFHTNVTVYRRNGSQLDSIYKFTTSPVDPFASGHYEMLDNLNSATLIWDWTDTAGKRFSSSVVIPLS